MRKTIILMASLTVATASWLLNPPAARQASAQDRSQFTCTQSGEACARYYPQWANTKCAQAAAACNSSPRGNGMCYFSAPDGKGSGLRRCG